MGTGVRAGLRGKMMNSDCGVCEIYKGGIRLDPEFSRSSWDGDVDDEIMSIADNLKCRNGIWQYR